MANGVKQCPECALPLVSEYRQTAIVWACPKAHGVGVNIFDAVGYLQRDELDAIWSNAAGAPLSKLPSPISGKLMARVTFMADDDEEYDNVGANAREMEVELDTENYFAWFSLEELNSMPTATKPAGGAIPGMVGLGALDAGEAKYDDIFAGAEKYAGPAPSSSNLGGMLGSVARLLSKR